jgi:cysteinyl-tRNA synthetase
MVEGKKMSKSLGNFYTLRDLLGKGFSGREIRFALLQAHYRETFNFTMEGLQRARTSLQRIDECLGKLRELDPHPSAPANGRLPGQLAATLDEDLNISGAWGAVFEWIAELNRRLAGNSLAPAEAASALAAWRQVDTVLGVGAPESLEVPDEITALVEARQAARKAKDFKRADALRDELKAKGWVIDDTPKGPRAKPL